MYSTNTALRHFTLVAICVLVADLLPRWQKLWFVAESGKFGTGAFVSLLLVVALFKRWRHAFNFMQVWLIVRLCLSAYIIYNNIADDGPILGHLIVNTLNLAALGILCCSSDVRSYLNDQPERLAQNQSSV